MATSENFGDLSKYSETVTENLNRPFTVSGRRGYLVGHMDGSFPDLGHHIPGEMGGLWVPPVKLVDGWWFGVREAGSNAEWQWLFREACTSFTMSPGQAIREFSVSVGGKEVKAAQEFFIADDEPAHFISLTLANPASQNLKLEVAWLVRFDVRGAWWSEWPDRPDEASFEPAKGAIIGRDSLTTTWGAFIQGDTTPQSGEVGSDLWGPEKTASLKGSDNRKEGIYRKQNELQGEGISGRLIYAVELDATSQTTLNFVIAGSDKFNEKQQAWAENLLANRQEYLDRKLASQVELLSRTPSLATPQPEYSRIFDGSALCLDMLTQDIPNLGHGIMAGLQGFAWYFGCDTYYTLSGLLVSGQEKTGIDTLNILASYGRNQRGRIPHEIIQTGELFNPGNQVETGEFATSVERAFRWTGDRAFLNKVYPVVVEGIFKFLLEDSDPEGTLLPEGPGILELSTALRGRKLDVAASLFQGLQSLAYLAGVMGDTPTRQRCEDLTGKVREQIDKYFFDPAQGEYVWRIESDLSIRPGEPPHGYVNLEFGVVHDLERAKGMFELAEGPAHTGPRGLVLPGSTDFVMAIQNAILALAEFRYNRPDEGLRYLQFCADEYAYYMPWAIPEFIGHDSCFIQAWSSATFNWLAVQGFMRLNPDPARNVIEVRPQLPSSWNFLEVKNLNLWGTAYDLRLDREADGSIKFSSRPGKAQSATGSAQFVVITDSVAPVSFV